MDTLEDKVKAYLGLPPHNTWSNYLIGDYWYIESLRKQYGEDTVNKILEKLRRK